MKKILLLLIFIIMIHCTGKYCNAAQRIEGEWLKIASQDNYESFESRSLIGPEYIEQNPVPYRFTESKFFYMSYNGKETSIDIEYFQDNQYIRFKDSDKLRRITWLANNNAFHIQEKGIFIKKREFKNQLEYKLTTLAINVEAVLRDVFFSLKLSDFEHVFVEHNKKFNNNDPDLLNFNDVSIVNLKADKRGEIAGYMVFRIHDLIKGIHTKYKNYVLQNYVSLSAAQVETLAENLFVVRLPHPEHGSCYIPMLIEDTIRKEYILLQPCRSRESANRQIKAYHDLKRSIREADQQKAERERMKRVVQANMLKGIRIEDGKVSVGQNGSITFSVRNGSSLDIAALDMGFVILDKNGFSLLNSKFFKSVDVPPGGTAKVQQLIEDLNILDCYKGSPPQEYDSKFPEYLAKRVADGRYTFKLFLKDIAVRNSGNSAKRPKMYLPNIEDEKLRFADGKWYYDTVPVDSSIAPIPHWREFRYDASTALDDYEKFAEQEKARALDTTPDIECKLSLGIDTKNNFSLSLDLVNLLDNDVIITELQLVRQEASGKYHLLYTVKTPIRIESLSSTNQSFTLLDLDKKARSYLDRFGDKDLKIRIVKFKTI